MNARRTGQASQGRRRGAVYSVRLTEEERAALEALQRQGGGPRRLGPWLVWRALAGEPPAPGAGSTGSSGYYPAGEVVPGRGPVLPGLGYYQPWPGTTSAGEGTTGAASRIILDLCGGSGSWSRPYVEAGYDVRLVTLPDCDVRTYVPPPGVWGILAAPPCTQFSLARNGHPELARDFVEGMACVNACLRIVLQCKPRWWALENPTGYLGAFLGTPRDVWEPCDFGDPWTKRTAVWGDYALPRRGPFVEPLGGGPLCKVCDPARRSSTWCSNPAHRAVTPSGFARAFFAANP